jgi:hypothetical protein
MATKFAAKSSAPKQAPKQAAPSSREELLAEVQEFEFQTCEIVGGRKFPLGEKFDCVKVGISSYGKAYTVLSVNGEDQFCDPKNLKVLKPMTEAKVAAAKAALEEAKEATLIVSGTIKNESEKAVLLSHHNWYKAKWFPKTLITKIGDHEDGEQSLYEVPRWKILADHGPAGVKELQALQEGFEEMLGIEDEEPVQPEPKPVVRPAGKFTGKIKR